MVLAGLLGLSAGGRPRRFARPELARNGLLAFGVLAQVTALVARHPGVYALWLGFGAAALVLYARRNRGRPGLLLAAAGLLLNVVVIAVNGGMPVSVAAAGNAGVPSTRLDLATDPLREPTAAGTVLPWLGETIPFALPLRPAVASAGDVLAAAGAAVFVFTGLTGRGRPAPAPVETGKRRRRLQDEPADEASGPVPTPTSGPTSMPHPVDAATASTRQRPDAAREGVADVGATGVAAAELTDAARTVNSSAAAQAADASEVSAAAGSQSGRKAARQARRGQRATADATPSTGAELPEPTGQVPAGAGAAAAPADAESASRSDRETNRRKLRRTERRAALTAGNAEGASADAATTDTGSAYSDQPGAGDDNGAGARRGGRGSTQARRVATSLPSAASTTALSRRGPARPSPVDDDE